MLVQVEAAIKVLNDVVDLIKRYPNEPVLIETGVKVSQEALTSLSQLIAARKQFLRDSKPG